MTTSRHAAITRTQIDSIQRLATQLRQFYDAHEFQRGLQIARQLLKIVVEIFPESSPEILDARRNVAELVRVNGQPKKAETELLAIMKIEARNRRTRQAAFSETCNNLAACLIDQQRYSEAARYLQRSIRVLEKIPAPEIQRIVICWKNLGDVQARSGKIEAAAGSFHHALWLCCRHRQLNLPEAGDCLDNLVLHLLHLGRIRAAETAVRQASSLAECGCGGVSLTIQIMLCQGEIAGTQLRRRESAHWNRKAWQHAVQHLPPGPGYSLAIRAATSLASSYSDLGLFNEAVEMAEWAVRHNSGSIGLHLPPADLLVVLGKMLYEAGHHHRARLCLMDALREQKNRQEKPDKNSMIALEHFALLGKAQGRTSEAVRYAERALELSLRHKLAPYRVRSLLRLLGSLLTDSGEYDRSEALLRQALALVDPVSARAAAETARILHALAYLADKRGNLRIAEGNYRKSLRWIAARVGSEFDLDTAPTWNNLGTLAHRQRKYNDAAAYYGHALQANRSGHDDSHPGSVSTLFNLSAVEWARGNWAQSLDLRAQSIHWCLARLPVLLGGGSESDRRHAVKDLRGRIYSTISFHLENPGDRAESARLAAAMIVQAKGLALDVMAHDLACLHASGDRDSARILRKLLRLRHCRSELAFRIGRGLVPRSSDRLRRLQFLEEQLIDRLHAQTPPSQTALVTATYEDVIAALPPGSALIEYVRFGVYRAASALWDGYRYAALVLRSGMPPVVLDAGESQSVELQAELLYAALNHRSDTYFEPAHRLHSLVLEPLLPYLNGITNLLIVPDGLLNLVPFAVLPGLNERYLMRSHVISYLSSARDLLRKFQAPRQSALFVFDSADPVIQKGLYHEQQAAHAFFPGAHVLCDFHQARKTIADLHGPRVLHLAMHGDFLDDKLIHADGPAGGELPAEQLGMLNAVLVMTETGRKKVLMTALEAATLDLHGTQLVVLAACRSGVGMILNGEGIYGFRRALALAGTAAQLATLWPVEDLSIADLVTRFYHAAMTHPAPLALALAQRDVEQSERWKHPFYWAPLAFSCGPQELELWEKKCSTG